MDASEAANIVAATLGSGAPGTDRLNAAAGILATLSDRDRLLELIDAIRSNSALVKRCAAASSRHPLGHDKIMLIDHHSSFNLRLHAWWPNRNPGVEHVHHHRFGMATTVLRGQYQMQLFRQAASGTAMIEYRQRSSADAREWYLDSAGVTHLQLLTTAKIIEGEGYTLTADALHRVVIPPGAICLTMFLAVIADSGMPEQTRVFATPGTSAPTLIRASALTADDYRRLLDAVALEVAEIG